MSSTNKTTHFELSQYIGTDKPTYLGDYNSDMLAIDTAIYTASENASTAVSTANSAASAASDAATAASAATTTANNAADKADLAKTTAETASTNASAALTAAQGAETAAAANTITNLAPAYDPTLTYAVDDLVTYIDGQGSGKLYKCIVAVESPEAFNINKWDDVTTSEVYSKKLRLISSITGDGVKTRKELLTELMTGINLRVDSIYTLIERNTTLNQSYIYNCDLISTDENSIKFSRVDRSLSNGNISIINYFINGGNISSYDTQCNNIVIDGVTLNLTQNDTSNAVPTTAISFLLYTEYLI